MFSMKHLSCQGGLFCLLLAVLYLLPLYWPHYFAHDVQRLAQHLLLLFVLPVLGLYLPQAKLSNKNIFLCLLLSLATALAYCHGVVLLEYGLLGLLLLAALLYSRCRVPDHNVYVGVVVLASLQALLALSSLLGSLITWEPLRLFDLSVVYSNYRFLNHAQTVWIPMLFAVLYFCSAQQRKALLLITGLVIFHWVLIFQMGARATTIGLMLAALLTLLLFRAYAWPLVKRFFVLAFLGWCLKILIFDVFLPAVGPPVEDAQMAARLQQLDQPRLQLWHRAWVGIQRSPWLGNGASSFASFEQLQRDIDTEPKLVSAVGAYGAHPHNFYLQIGYEFGLPFLFFCLGTALWLLWRMSRALLAQPAGSRREMGLCLWLGLLAVAIDALFSGNFVMPMAQCWIAVLLGLSLKGYDENRLASEQSSVAFAEPFWRPRRLLFLLMLAAAMTLQGALVWRELPELKVDFENREKIFATGIRNPRFWSHGWH